MSAEDRIKVQEEAIKDAQDKIEVMQAFIEGKEIQLRRRVSGTNWAISPAPAWAWDSFDYRIKPEHIEIWITYYPHGRPHPILYTVDPTEQVGRSRRVKKIVIDGE